MRFRGTPVCALSLRRQLALLGHHTVELPVRRPALPAGTNASAREAARDGHAAVRPRKRCAHTHAHAARWECERQGAPIGVYPAVLEVLFRDARRRCRLRRGSLYFALSFAFGALAAAHIRSPRACASGKAHSSVPDENRSVCVHACIGAAWREREMGGSEKALTI